MDDLYAHVEQLLAAHKDFTSGGTLYKNRVLEAAARLDAGLLRILKNDPHARRYFFTEVEGALVFHQQKLQRFISNKAFLPDSYTAFRNKIGLHAHSGYIAESAQTVLAFPYKDAVLEGGQTRDEKRRQEVFINEELAPEAIDRLLEPKALSGWQRISAKSAQTPKQLNRTDHFLLKGNNLLSLYSLEKVYAGSIRMIYIDPPYNTQKDTFSYNDRFSHSTWLTFMKNRLEVARRLLSPDGVIFISIDINEQAYLKVLADELFGREHFVGEIIWETATDNNATQIALQHEYVLCYARDKARLPKWQIRSEKAQLIIDKHKALRKKYGEDTQTIEKELRKWIKQMQQNGKADLSGVAHYSYVDEQGVFYPGNSANTRPGGYNFDIVHPKTGRVCAKPANGYRWPQTTFEKARQEGNVLWGKDEKAIPKIKKRIESATELLKSYYYEDNRKSTHALSKLMGRKVFDNPKSVNLLKKLIKFATGPGDIVLDFFAGSGSTAQAVAEANAEQGNRRSFILCEQMEYIETITKERIRKIIGHESFVYAGLAPANAPLMQQIRQAENKQALQAIARKIAQSSYASYSLRASASSLEAAVASSEDVDAVRKGLLDALDKNWMYIPLPEMEDTDWKLDAESKKLTRQFYNL